MFKTSWSRLLSFRWNDFVEPQVCYQYHFISVSFKVYDDSVSNNFLVDIFTFDNFSRNIIPLSLVLDGRSDTSAVSQYVKSCVIIWSNVNIFIKAYPIIVRNRTVNFWWSNVQNKSRKYCYYGFTCQFFSQLQGKISFLLFLFIHFILNWFNT